jgi:predicted GIY-YIG superfamily endonuclease
MAGRLNGTLNVGVTSNPVQRAWHHKQGAVGGCTRKAAESAVTREKHFSTRKSLEDKMDRAKQSRVERSS